MQLLTDKVRLLYSFKEFGNVRKIIDNSKEVDSYLKKNYSTTYLNILSDLKDKKKIKEVLDEKFKNAVYKNSLKEIVSLGRLYIKYNYRDDFLEKIYSLPEKDYILRQLNRLNKKRKITRLDM